jgi:hypothetical protein
MAGRIGSGLTVGFIGLTLVMAGCGYDKPNSANDANSGNGSGYIAEPGVEASVTTASGDLTQALATFRAQLGPLQHHRGRPGHRPPGNQLGRSSGRAHQPGATSPATSSIA